MSQNLNKLFEDLLTRYVGAIEKNYTARYKKAKDKDFVKQELITDTEFVLGWSLLIPEHSQMIDLFATWYKRGEEITDILDHIRTTYGEVEDERPFKRIENGKEIALYLSEEEKALKKIALDQRKLLKLLVRHTAYREIQSKFRQRNKHQTYYTFNTRHQTQLQMSLKISFCRILKLLYLRQNKTNNSITHHTNSSLPARQMVSQN